MLSLTRCCGWRAVETHCQGGAHAHPSHLYSAGNDPPYDAPDSKNFQNFMIPPDRPSFGVSRTRGRKLAASGRFTLAAATFARLLRAYCMSERGAAGSRAFARAGEGAGFGAVVAPASGSLVRAFAGAADAGRAATIPAGGSLAGAGAALGAADADKAAAACTDSSCFTATRRFDLWGCHR